MTEQIQTTLKTTALPLPKKVYIPLRSYGGEIAEPLVKIGDAVCVGTKIASYKHKQNNIEDTVFIFSSVSGVVQDITQITLADDNTCEGFIISTDKRQKNAPIVHPIIKNKQDFEYALRVAGITALDSALQNKANKAEQTFDTLLIHATQNSDISNHVALMEEGDALLGTVSTLMKMYNIPHCLIIIDREDRIAVDLYFSLATGMKGVEVRPTETKLANASVKLILKKLFGRRLKEKQKTADVGVLALDINSACTIGHYLATSMPPTTQRITVLGDIPAEPISYIAPFGTSIKHIMRCADIGNKTPLHRIVQGKSAFENEVVDWTSPITQQMNRISFFSERACVPPKLSFWEKPLPACYKVDSSELVEKPTIKHMYNMLTALLPCVICAFLLFGIDAILLVGVSVLSCIIFEYFFCKFTHKKTTLSDGSAIVTGALLGLNFSAALPLWYAIIGAFFAIVVAKMLCGGLGKNAINPVALAYTVLLIIFPNGLTNWVPPTVFDASQIDGNYSPMPQSDFQSWFDLLLGLREGAIGTVSTFAILAGFAYLILTKTMRARITLATLGTAFFFYWIIGFNLNHILFELCSGSFLFMAVFMASDPATSPKTHKGQCFYGIGLALCSIAISHYSLYPASILFGLLLMNLCVKIFDNAEV